MTVPAEFPGISLICMSNRPNKYSFLVAMPEPEDLSIARDMLEPPSCMLARLSPKRMLKSVLKFPPKAIVVEAKQLRESMNKTYEEAMLI